MAGHFPAMTVAAPPPPVTADKARRAELRQQRRRSVFWTAVYLLGSLNLAMVLLVTIAGAVAFATIMESKFDTAVARYYIYHAAWFYFWLLLLALNLAAAALTPLAVGAQAPRLRRHPRRHHPAAGRRGYRPCLGL